ncbi:MAG: TlpA disulfide reductase family protein [Candidatus Zixiibacteriota bacterium]
MIIKPPIARITKIGILALLLFSLSSSGLSAAPPPDSIDAVQALLPDSVSLAGKVVYVDFWASWCVPCRHSFPWMQKIYEKYHDKGLEIIAVNVDKEFKAAGKFLQDTKPTFQIVYDSTGTLAEQYSLEVMPTSFIYDRTGKLVSSERGFRDYKADSLDTAILELLNARSSK